MEDRQIKEAMRVEIEAIMKRLGVLLAYVNHEDGVITSATGEATSDPVMSINATPTN